MEPLVKWLEMCGFRDVKIVSFRYFIFRAKSWKCKCRCLCSQQFMGAPINQGVCCQFEPFPLPTGLEVWFVPIYVEKNSKISECYLHAEEVSAGGSVFLNSPGLWIRGAG